MGFLFRCMSEMGEVVDKAAEQRKLDTDAVVSHPETAFAAQIA